MPTFFEMISMLWNNGSRTGLWNLILTSVKYILRITRKRNPVIFRYKQELNVTNAAKYLGVISK